MSRSIGLDIGHHAVRAVVCERSKGAWSVVAFAHSPRQDANGEPRPLAAVLSELDSRLNLRRGQVTVSDTARNVLIRFVPTMPLPPERLAKLLRLELAQHAGEGGELAADVHEVPLAGDEIIHGAVMAQPEQIRDLLAELKRAGITPRRIHAGAAALANATLVAPICQDQEMALLVDVGSSTTRVALVGGEGRLLAFRQLALGGESFTRAIAESRNLSAPKAEAIKVRWTLGHALEAAAISPEKAATVADGHDAPETVAQNEVSFVPAPEAKPMRSSASLFLDEEVAQPGHQTMELGGVTLGPEMTRVAENLYTQLASTIAWFKAQLQNNSLNPTRVLLCGGGAGLIGLEAYLSRRFKVAVDRYDPFPDLGANIPQPGHDFALALGLALSEDPRAVRLDLLPETEIRRTEWKTRLIWPYVAAAAIILAGVICGVTMLQAQWQHQASLDRFATYRERFDALSKQHADLEAEREALSDDLRVVASRIHFNRDLLYVVRVLKEQASSNRELWVTRLETIPPAAEPRVATGPRMGVASGGAKAAPVENTIARGAIEIEGRVKFDIDRTLDADGLSAFFNNYMKSLDKSVAGSSGVDLFDATKTEVFMHWLHEEETAPKPDAPNSGKKKRVADGSFPFGVRFHFRPIELDQATAELEGGI